MFRKEDYLGIFWETFSPIFEKVFTSTSRKTVVNRATSKFFMLLARWKMSSTDNYTLQRVMGFIDRCFTFFNYNTFFQLSSFWVKLSFIYFKNDMGTVSLDKAWHKVAFTKIFACGWTAVLHPFLLPLNSYFINLLFSKK